MEFELTIQAAPVAGGELLTVEYTAASEAEAVAAFWSDVDAFGLAASKVVAVRVKYQPMAGK